jgi:hypothetical protein
MKKSILFAILLCNTLLAMAENRQFIGLQLGFTQPITRLNEPVQGQETVFNSTTYNGFKVGLVYDATIVKGFGYTIGINYTFAQNHNKWEKKGDYEYPRKKTQSFYHQLEIPVDWQYKFTIAKDTWLILYTGPTLQFGLSFRDNIYNQNASNETITKDSQNKYDNLKVLNVTWGLGAGLQYQRYFVRGGYDFGIVNPYKEQMFAGHDIYTRGRFDQWQIKLGIYLWDK